MSTGFESSTVVELRALLVTVEKAINQQDIETLEAVLHDDVVISHLDGTVAHGIPAVRAYFEEKLGGSSAVLESYQVKNVSSNPAKFYGNIVTADGTVKDEFVFANGSALTVDTIWTATILKQEDKWKIVQLHFSSNIFDNPLLNAAKQNIMLFTAIAAVIALIIGFFLGSFISKKRAAK